MITQLDLLLPIVKIDGSGDDTPTMRPDVVLFGVSVYYC